MGPPTVFADPGWLWKQRQKACAHGSMRLCLQIRGGCEGKDKKRAPMEACDCVCTSGVVVRANRKSVHPWKHATAFADPGGFVEAKTKSMRHGSVRLCLQIRGGCGSTDKKRAPMEARDCVCRSGVVVKAKTKSVHP